MMNTAIQYRQKAQELLVLAGTEANPNLRIAFAAMSESYLRLAALAERNSKTDLVYETPPAKAARAIPA
jgi:hypothetical protein